METGPRPRCGGESPLWSGDLVRTLRVQKRRWARNGPFPLKNGLFLVYSTIAEIRDISCRSGGEAVVGRPRGTPPLVGRPRCDGEIRFQIFNF